MSTGFAFKQSLHLCSVSNLRILLVFQLRSFKVGFLGPKTFRGFRETGPRWADLVIADNSEKNCQMTHVVMLLCEKNKGGLIEKYKQLASWSGVRLNVLPVVLEVLGTVPQRLKDNLKVEREVKYPEILPSRNRHYIGWKTSKKNNRFQYLVYT